MLRLPVKVCAAWLFGTYVTFLAVGDVAYVNNLIALSVFVISAAVIFVLAYLSESQRSDRVAWPGRSSSRLSTTSINLLAAASAIFYGLYGVVYMRQFGVSGIADVVNAVRDPGNAYLAKFKVFEQQASANTVDLGAQVLTLAAVLSAPLVPLVVLYWKKLDFLVKGLAIVGLSLYAVFFLSLGTLVGLGTLLLSFASAAMVLWGRRREGVHGDQGSRRTKGRFVIIAAIAVLVVSFATYMSYNQGKRLSDVGVQSEFAPNPAVSRVFGDEFARGVTAMVRYPTHGYRGLSYNLETPFRWTHGRGASIALDSYLEQYGFGVSRGDQAYPARTEVRTGWPKDMYWATIYPWLASDLSFPGAALAMGVVGWWLSRFWREAVMERSLLSTLLFGQLVVLVAFVPANNQIGLSRPNLICFATLCVIYVVARVRAHGETRRTQVVTSRREVIR